MTSVGGDNTFSNNIALPNLNGLSALTFVGGCQRIKSNDTLANIDGLSALTSIGACLQIENSDELANIDGLSALTSIGGLVSIRENGALINMDGLSALTSVGEFLSIVNNDALTNIDGLSAIASLGGLSGLIAVGGPISIYNNLGLCQNFVDDFLEQVGKDGERIDNNDGYCPPVCGDGIVETGESCDDANTTDGDCCSSSCEIEPTGTVCGPAADICGIEEVCDGISPACPDDERLPDTDTDGTCDAYDVCPDDANPSQADTDEDGRGDACDPCTGGIDASKPLLRGTNFTAATGNDKLKYKAKLVFDGTVSISPQAQGFRLLVEDANDDILIDLEIPAGLYDPITRSGWIPATNGKKFQYITKTPVDGLLPKVILKWNPRRPNEVLVNVNGKSGNFADPNVALPLKATISLDPTDAMTSLCAEAEFPGPKPLPHCRISGNGVALICR
ncbi:DUF4215 domain-containing protein [bacterium]|nr:DUF4215 domain-containing protein [bacterium]